jgi:heme-degrading monooxygenase HmoA
MIARIWHGKVSQESGNTFFEYIRQTGLPGLIKSKGNLGVQILRRDDEGTSHFLIISFWDSSKSIRRFSGPDISKARLYPEDRQFLLEIEQPVHYEVLIND